MLIKQKVVVHFEINLNFKGYLNFFTGEFWRGCEYYHLEWFFCHAISVAEKALIVDVRIFKYQCCIFSQGSLDVPWFVFLKLSLYMRRVWLSEFSHFWKRSPATFVLLPYTNSTSIVGVAEKLISFSSLNQKEEASTLKSLSISSTQWQLIIFHLPGAGGYVFGSKSIFKHTLLLLQNQYDKSKNLFF